VAIAVLFYFAFLRPVQQERARQRRELANLQVGDEVLTQAGFIAVVKEIRVPEERGPTEVILDLGGLDVRAHASAIAHRLRWAEPAVEEDKMVEQGQGWPMRNRTNWILLAFVVALTAFSVIVVWPGAPKRYLPDFVPWPEGKGLQIGGFERKEMRLGLDLKGGSYVLLEGDCSRLPPGTDCGEALEGAKDVLERRVDKFGV
jgi:preprotein translocase YajC subunit